MTTAGATEQMILDKWALFDYINYNPHQGQLQIAESRARYRVASCGRRFGKSDIGGHELVPEALLTRHLKDALIEVGKLSLIHI